MITAKQIYPPLTFSEIPLGQARAVTLIVQSQPAPVFVYLLDADNYARWQSGRKFVHHGPGSVKDFLRMVVLPHAGPWWLVLENRSETQLTLEFGHTKI